MKNAATYFNKVLALTAAERDDKSLAILRHGTGLLLEMSEGVRYQYFISDMPAANRSIEVPFTAVYGKKKILGYDISEETFTLHTDTGDNDCSYRLLENKEEKFKVIARLDIDALSDAIHGSTTFAKKGKHVYNQKTFVKFAPTILSVFCSTDISIMKAYCEAEVGGNLCVAIDNSLVPKIKKWLNYANNPKNGGGDMVWVLIGGNSMKLQVQNCSCIFPISALPAYNTIVDKLNSMLTYRYEVEEYELDWDDLSESIKSKDEFIPFAEKEMLRTFSADFINYCATHNYDVYKLNTTANALLFDGDTSKVLLMLKEKEDEE